jgi:predicted negative regulator of RcsB-dependent stress response
VRKLRKKSRGFAVLRCVLVIAGCAYAGWHWWQQANAENAEAWAAATDPIR